MIALAFAACTAPALLQDSGNDPTLVPATYDIVSISCEGRDMTDAYAGSIVEVGDTSITFGLAIEGCPLDQVLDLEASEIGPLEGCGYHLPGDGVAYSIADDIEIAIAGSALGCTATTGAQARPTVKIEAR